MSESNSNINTYRWFSLDPIKGMCFDPYPDNEVIENAYQSNIQQIYLSECFNATIHLVPPFHQTTPQVRNKPKGYRSVIRAKIGDRIPIYFWDNKKRWYVEQPSNITLVKNIVINDIELNPPTWQWCDLDIQKTN